MAMNDPERAALSVDAPSPCTCGEHTEHAAGQTCGPASRSDVFNGLWCACESGAKGRVVTVIDETLAAHKISHEPEPGARPRRCVCGDVYEVNEPLSIGRILDAHREHVARAIAAALQREGELA